MQEEKGKQILNLKELEPNLLDILPLDNFISNQKLPHIEEVINLESPYRDEVRNQELPHIDEVGNQESPLIVEIRNQELPPRGESSVDSTTLSNQEQQSKQLKRKRKRPPKTGEKVHTKESSDNIHRKIQVHFLSFVVSFMNVLLTVLLKKSEYPYEFIGIDYNIKKVISKKNFLSFKNKNIGEILCLKASPKFRTKNEENNSIIYEKVKENKDVNYFLSKNFMKLFKDVYLKNKRSINENGIVFDLPRNVETFDDFLNKQKRKYDDIKEYEQKINDVIKRSYLDIFTIKKN